MRFGAVSSQLLALGSQLNYSPYRRMRWVFLIYFHAGVDTRLYQAPEKIASPPEAPAITHLSATMEICSCENEPVAA